MLLRVILCSVVLRKYSVVKVDTLSSVLCAAMSSCQGPMVRSTLCSALIQCFS